LAQAGSVTYLVGAGEDISLDLELWRRGCLVRTLDPTPRAIEYVTRVAPDDARFRFEPVGMWGENTVLKFYAPAEPSHVSHSVANLQGTSTYFEAEVLTLASAMALIGDARVDLLKLDIEGAEHEVIANIVRHDVRPGAICLEFDPPCSLRRMRKTTALLRDAGYTLQRTENWNCTFVRTATQARDVP